MNDQLEPFYAKIRELRQSAPKRMRDAVVQDAMLAFPTLMRREVEALYDELYPEEVAMRSRPLRHQLRDLSAPEAEALKWMQSAGFYTAGGIAKNCGCCTRSEMAQFRVNILEPMRQRGLVAFIDDQKPAMYKITDLGRALLAELEKGGAA